MDTNTRTACGLSARFSLVGGIRGFLTTVGLAGLMTAGALAQPQPQTRAAILLPPQPLAPGEAAPLARGAPDDTSTGATTPVVRSGAAGTPRSSTPAGSGPAWLSGSDPNIVPTGGSTPPHTTVVNAGPLPTGGAPRATQPASREEPSLLGKGVDKLKGTVGSGDRQPTTNPNVMPDANTPFQGMAPNGAPMYAGPPAYRWYGYGAVTPGANPYAPTGQYPKASANWYSVTGATPGAFPVPVMNPLRMPPGIDPPAYAVASPARATATVVTNPAPPVGTTTPTMPVVGYPNPAAGSGSKFEQTVPPSSIEPRLAPPPNPTSAISAPIQPEPAPRAMPVATPVGVPTLSPPPGMVFVPPVQPIPVKPAEPVAAPVAATVPVPPVDLPPVGPTGNSAAVPRPGVGADDVRWQPTGEVPRPPEGTWTPAPGIQQPGARRADPQPIARGQIGDASQQPDPLGNLIRTMCRGRASAVEIRWTGTKRVTVCFEARTEADAAKLVKDISARPELGPLQIDFCVLVK